MKYSTISICIGAMSTILAFVVSAETPKACHLLTSCLEAAEDKYAGCDVILDQEKPACWLEMKQVVTALRQMQGNKTAAIRRCIDEPNPLPVDNILPQYLQQQCAAMVGNYENIADRQGWRTRSKRSVSKDEVKFLNCMHMAKRQNDMCFSLSRCCPKERKCRWQGELTAGNSQGMALTRLHLFGVRQNCLKTIADGGHTQNIWPILKDQPIWQHEG